MSCYNCWFLTCLQVSQEASQVAWYSHLFKKFPHFIVIHTVKGFGIVNKAEIDVFVELSCFSHDPENVKHREEEEKKKDHDKILEEIIVENFPKMGKEIVTQVQETQRVPNRINPKQTPQDTY